MAKKYTDYDNALIGQYIRQIENPDSIGWNPDLRIWEAPKGKAYDYRNRGMGVDILNNAAAKKLTEGRPGRYLTEAEEKQLRNEHIQYALDVIDRHKKSIPALQNMSPRKTAEVVGAIYRGDAKQLWNKDSLLGKALRSNEEDDFHNAINDFYNSNGLKARAKNNAIFWKEHETPVYPIPVVEHIERPDAITLVNPYTTKIQNITFTDQYVPTSPAYNLVEADKVSSEINEYDKVRRAIDAQAAYRRLIQDNAWENQEPKRYVPTSGINYVIDSYSEGGKLDRKKSWDELSMKEKADMIRVAVDNSITTLPEIREKYNEFAMGGDAEETYDEPQTFAGDVTKALGGSPQSVRNADVLSSTVQLTSYGIVPSLLDLGRDLNRAYHKEEGAVKDATLDVLSMLPFINKYGLKEAKNFLKDNRKLLNSIAVFGKSGDLVDDTYGANKTSNNYAIGGDIEETYKGRTLPEVEVTPNNVKLITYRPVIDDNYKWTGHSALTSPSRTFIEDPTWNGLMHGIDAIHVNHGPRNDSYNLFTNNCADATRRALEDISDKKMNPFLFTTPGDVKDFAEQELGGITHYRHGRYETIIPISQADRNKLANTDYYNEHKSGGPIVRDANIYDGTTEDSQQMETYEAPWVTEAKEREIIRRNWLEEQAAKYAQAVEDAKHPTGHYMNELVVTPSGSSIGSVSSDAMLDNLLSSTRERQVKDRRDASNMVKHIHEGTDTAAKALYPLVAAPAAPYLYSGITGLMANPYTDALLTSAGGAHAIQSLADGKANALTALEVLPMTRLVKPIANTAISAYTSLVDKYPGIEQYPRYAIGKFKYGFDTELPTLYRKIDKVPNIQNGRVNVSSPNNRFAYDNGFGEESPIITNMTTDAPVRSHSDGDWDRKLTLAFSGKNLLGKHVVSTRPSDTFIIGDNLTVPVKDVTAISGRAKEVNTLNNNGIKTISSPEVEAFWESGVEDYIDKVAKYRKDYTNWINTNGIRLNKLQEPIDNFSNYARSVEDLTRESFKSPTLKDYQFMDYVFKPKYKSQVSPVVEDMDFSFLNRYPETFGSWIGSEQRRRYLYDSGRWANVMYDPITSVEADYRRGLNIGLKPQYKR